MSEEVASPSKATFSTAAVKRFIVLIWLKKGVKERKGRYLRGVKSF